MPSPPSPSEVLRFTDCPFSDSLQQALADAGYETPTPIQAQGLRPALEGRDLIGLAQTGTGKTAVFALPIIHRLARRMELGALVLGPTRELVQQIVGVFHQLGDTSGIRVACIVGGIKIEKDWKALRSWPNVVVGTPGRLLDHLEQKTISFKEVEVLIVDEADRMHDMGFIPQIRRIIAALPTERQTMMFTATLPADVEQIARRSMRDPVRIQAGPASRPVERARQTLYHLQDAEKVPLLLSLLRKESGRVLVFVRTKRGVDRLARRVIDRRLSVARLHGDREQNQRDEAMAGFRQGRYRVLIATDIAARGLDVADIEHVINFDFPRSPEDYIHRIGRTARLAADGRATSFVTPKDRGLLHDLERLLGSKIPLTTAPGSKVAVQPDAAPGRSPAHGRPHTAHAAAHGRSGAHGASAHGRSGEHGASAHGRSGAHGAGAHGRSGEHGAGAHGRSGTHGASAHGRSGEHGATASAQASAVAGPGSPGQCRGNPGRRRRRRGRGRGGARPVPQGEADAHQAQRQSAAPVGQPDAISAARNQPEPADVAAQPPENGWPAIARFGWELAE